MRVRGCVRVCVGGVCACVCEVYVYAWEVCVRVRGCVGGVCDSVSVVCRSGVSVCV